MEQRKDLTVDTVKQLKGHLQSCTHAVDRDCSFIAVEDESDDGIAEAIRQIDSISRCSDKKTACVYEVGAAIVPNKYVTVICLKNVFKMWGCTA